MKNIFKIYKNDIKEIFNNYALLIVIVGLLILPSLYAWFNIKASWNPYGNTENISVAVVNNDAGNHVLEKDINVGDELIKKLKDNHSLGWDFVDKKTAIKGVKSGKYYASVEIPKDFSKNLTSLVTEDVKKGEIIYTVNEKTNAIAPKITEKGATTIQLEVNQTVVKTVSEIIFKVFNEVGTEIEVELPKLSKVESSLKEVQGKFAGIDETINLASDASTKISNILSDAKKDMPLIKNTLADSKNLAGDLKVFLNNSKTSLKQVSPIIKNDLSLVKDVSSYVSKLSSDVIVAVNNGSKDIAPMIDSLSDKLNLLSSGVDNLNNFLKKLNSIGPSNSLESTIAKLEESSSKIHSSIDSLNAIKNQVNSGKQPSIDALNKIQHVATDINGISSSLLGNFDSSIVTPINNIFDDSIKLADDALVVLDKAQAKLPEVEDIIDTSLKFTGSADKNLAFIKEKLPQAKKIVNELVSALDEINNSEDMSSLVELLKNDIMTQSDFLKQPVNLKTERLYPIENYGTGMTPFYSVLSFWVGILLLLAILSVEPHGGEYKPYEIYFGRSLIFVTLSIIQCFIISAGDLFLLKVVAKDAGMFILLSLFIGIVFTFIVYSLVSVFGNVGKAIAIILLVLQVAGSGGTFPIQVTPKFFQMINPCLPFTYAISALRETVGGIYYPNLYKDLIVLSVFLVAFVLASVLLKSTLYDVSVKLRKKFNESNLTGH